MSDFELKTFIEKILTQTHWLLVREYGYTRKEAADLINKSKLAESIERKPLLFAHMTPEQVLDGVLD